jgi:hypothetical protein
MDKYQYFHAWRLLSLKEVSRRNTDEEERDARD